MLFMVFTCLLLVVLTHLNIVNAESASGFTTNYYINLEFLILDRLQLIASNLGVLIYFSLQSGAQHKKLENHWLKSTFGQKVMKQRPDSCPLTVRHCLFHDCAQKASQPIMLTAELDGTKSLKII